MKKRRANNCIKKPVIRQNISQELNNKLFHRPVEGSFYKNERSVTNMLNP